MNEQKICPYCGSYDTGKVMKSIGESPDCCFNCGAVWTVILTHRMDKDEIQWTRDRYYEMRGKQ